MSKNYDNWERLVAAVVKREQIRQLCHQDSVSTIYSGYSSSSHLDFTLPVFLRSFDAFESVKGLRHRNFRTTDLARLVQDVLVSDQQYLLTGTKVVIKSLKTSKMTEDEFEQHMIVVGNCRHENVATPWAYHFSEMTKLIFYEYYSHGSVFDMLHGNNKENDISRPSWESRLRIAVGAARGIAHIHMQCEGEMIHGNIKSSNIFVNSQEYGSVSDFGLAGIPGVMAPKWWDALEYHTSEHEFQSRPSQKSDVYSFGLVLLELLTGRSPVHLPYIANHLCLSESDTLDLIGVKHRIFPAADELDDMEEISPETFPFVDGRLINSVVQEELRNMLDVAKRCLAELPNHRPTMPQVVSGLENIAALSNQHLGNKKFVVSGLEDMAALSYQHLGNKKRIWHKLFPFGRS